MSKQLNQIIELCAEAEIEIISYGLSPNPNGFCFERGDNSTDMQVRRMSELLDGLSSKQERELRSIIFGGSNE